MSSVFVFHIRVYGCSEPEDQRLKNNLGVVVKRNKFSMSSAFVFQIRVIRLQFRSTPKLFLSLRSLVLCFHTPSSTRNISMVHTFQQKVPVLLFFCYPGPEVIRGRCNMQPAFFIGLYRIGKKQFTRENKNTTRHFVMDIVCDVAIIFFSTINT